MRFQGIFVVNKPVIGMIHLAGNSRSERVARALEELLIFQEVGINGAIIEDYHGNIGDVYQTLKESASMKLDVVRGVNVLSDPYRAFGLAEEFGARFIQFDSVQTPDLNLELYGLLRAGHPDVAVFGGVGFKYIPSTGNPLRQDLDEAMARCEAIVTTGEGTGVETPIEKLREYRRMLPDGFPLVVGAGVNIHNAYEQMLICDAAIVGSALKDGNDTRNKISAFKCKLILDRILPARFKR